MVVVRRLVGLAGVVDDAVLERDAALGEPVGELEVVERRDAGDGLDCAALSAWSHESSRRSSGT